MFDTILISVFFIVEIEAVSAASVFQRSLAVDEKHGVHKSRALVQPSEIVDFCGRRTANPAHH